MQGQDRLHELFEHSYARLVAQLCAVTGDVTEAEEVVSEAFARAASRPARFATVDNPEAWLRTVAVNQARTRHRRRIVGDRLLRRHTPVSVEVPGASDRALDLIRALRDLPITQREALALHYLADLPIQEVADTLGVPLGTVKARLSRGRTALAAVLAPTASLASAPSRKES